MTESRKFDRWYAEAYGLVTLTEDVYSELANEWNSEWQAAMEALESFQKSKQYLEGKSLPLYRNLLVLGATSTSYRTGNSSSARRKRKVLLASVQVVSPCSISLSIDP